MGRPRPVALGTVASLLGSLLLPGAGSPRTTPWPPSLQEPVTPGPAVGRQGPDGHQEAGATSSRVRESDKMSHVIT